MAGNRQVDYAERIGFAENPAPSELLWSREKIVMAARKKAKITNPATQQKIMTAFMECLMKSADSNNNAARADLISFMDLIIKTKHIYLFSQVQYSSGQVCYYTKFLKKCFELIEEDEHANSHCYEMIQTSGIQILLYLTESQGLNNNQILHQILDELLMKLILRSPKRKSDVVEEPSMSKISAVRTPAVIKSILEACKWRIGDFIREMLNSVLINGCVNSEPLSSCMYVYKIILELVFIDKALVLGLINNTELCLQCGRNDRMDGIKFFCKLFGSNRQGITNHVDFYSHLWQKFIFHCENTSIYEPEELKILALYTHSLLSQPSTHKDWCHLLFYLFDFVIDPESKLGFITGMTKALKENPSFASDESSKSLILLVKNMLTPVCNYELFGPLRETLLSQLGRIYQDVTKIAVYEMTNHNFHKLSSELLSCFLGTCGRLRTTSERWNQLQELFIKRLVPFRASIVTRMKMLLYLWIQAGEDGRRCLQELVARMKRARTCLKDIITVQEGAITTRVLPSALELMLLLNDCGKNKQFPQRFFDLLRSNAGLRDLLIRLFSQTSSCEDKWKTAIDITSLYSQFVEPEDKNMWTVFLFYVTEVICDLESMKVLISLVDSCVKGNEISTAMGLNRLHVARAALQLLKEILYLLPHLGCMQDVVVCLMSWSNVLNGSLSMLALQCLATVAPTLQNFDSAAFTNLIVPICFKNIKCGSRGQVKMAIRCLSAHGFSRNETVPQDILTIISSQLVSPLGVEELERAVSALGHFSAVCPPLMKNDVEKLCVLNLQMDIIDSFLQEVHQNDLYSDPSSNIWTDNRGQHSFSSSNVWTDWQELPDYVLIRLQAIRSLGRCLHYCGLVTSVTKALETLQEILILSPKDHVGTRYRDVDLDHLRYEAASNILFILEKTEFQGLITESLILKLSQVIIDARVEVRCMFARKLCHGLSPYKGLTGKGQRRGKLPPCLLGVLVLLGCKLWMSSSKSAQEAKSLLTEVMMSRFLYQQRKYNLALKLGSTRPFYAEEPLCVFENIFALAVPILAENFPEVSTEEVKLDYLCEVMNCFKFTCSVLCHTRIYGGHVSKDYIGKMITSAKEKISWPSNWIENQKYAMVFQILEVSVKRYRPNAKEPVCPPVELPPPFFQNTQRSILQANTDILSLPDLKKLETKVYATTQKEQEDADPSDSDDNIINSSFTGHVPSECSIGDLTDQSEEQGNDKIVFQEINDLTTDSIDDHSTDYVNNNNSSAASGYMQEFGRPIAKSTPHSIPQRRRKIYLRGTNALKKRALGNQ